MNNPNLTSFPPGLPAANNNNNARTFINYSKNNNRSVRAVRAPPRRGIRFNHTIRARKFNANNAPVAIKNIKPSFGKLNGTKNSKYIRGIPAGNSRRNNAWLAYSAQLKANAARSRINRPPPSRTAANAHAQALAHAASLAEPAASFAPAAPPAPTTGPVLVVNNNNTTCSGFGCLARVKRFFTGKGRRSTRRRR